MLRRHEKLSFPGSVHFVTTVTSERGKWFVRPSVCRGLLETFELCRSDLKVICLGYVLMPDHLHALVQQTSDGLQISELMRRFKRKTSGPCRPANYTGTTLWCRRFDDVPVPGTEAAWTKLNYIHENPLKTGLAATAEAYPWSSARAYAGIESGVVCVATELILPRLI